MTYAVTNPPIEIWRGGQWGGAMWKYDSADTAGTVAGAGYFTNALKLGMKKGDVVLRTTWSALPTLQTDLYTASGTSPTVTTMGFHIVLGVHPTTGVADLSDATALDPTNT